MKLNATLRLLLCVWLMVCSACGGKTHTPIPATVLSRDSMQSVLVDIHLADAAVQIQHLSGDTVKVLYEKYYAEVFVKHKISRQQFDESYDFYCKNADLLDDMYERIINELNKKAD